MIRASWPLLVAVVLLMRRVAAADDSITVTIRSMQWLESTQ